MAPPPKEDSAAVAARVAAARRLQSERAAALGVAASESGAWLNARLPVSALEEVARPDAGGRRLLSDAADALKLSARGYHRVLRVARTLADLDGAAAVGRIHLAEALAYRAESPPDAARAA
ncbi:hypothetical protein [Chenggangzhangella methanolivorans]|nr:hypothetical protein [Chenggangzhangella methanolivorans]